MRHWQRVLIMRVVKKEKFYVNSLNIPEPTPVQKVLKTVDLRAFQELKLEIYKERLVYFKGNAVQAAKSLKVQRNCYVQQLGAETIAKVRAPFKDERKQLFIAVFKQYSGNNHAIARRLQISPKTVCNLAVKYGVKMRTSRVKTTKPKVYKQMSFFND